MSVELCMVHWSFCLTCNVSHLFLKYPLLRDIVALTTLLIFSYVILSLCQSAIKGILRKMSLLNVRLPGLLARVECIAALMACTAMDKASSMYSLKLLCRYLYIGETNTQYIEYLSVKSSRSSEKSSNISYVCTYVRLHQLLHEWPK